MLQDSSRKMCGDCFKTEIRSFPDEKSWTSFDLELNKKLGQSKMKAIKFVQDMWQHKDDEEYIYECLTCGEKWKLRDPDKAFRGYFKKLSYVDKVTTRLTESQKVLLGLLIIAGLILIRVIYWWLTN
jgi:hypothetical protein